MRKLFLFCLILFTIKAWGQTTTSGNAETKGACSPAIPGHNNNVRIDCKIDSEQGKRMVEILNKILANQLDSTTVMGKLDELIAAAKQTSQTVNAPNGIGSIGGTLINPQVNNFAPIPRRIPENSKISVSACLAQHPGHISIVVLMNDTEAYTLGNDWVDIFTRAKWIIDDGGISQAVWSAPFNGTNILFLGSGTNATNVTYDKQSAEGVAVNCLLGARVGGPGALIPSPKEPEGHLTIQVGSEPK